MTFTQLAMFGLTKGRIALFFLLALGAAVFEGFGMAMFLPLLEFIEKGRDAAALAQDSRMWQYIVEGFALLNLEVTLVSLITALLLIMLLRVLVIYSRVVYSAWLGQDVMHHTRMSVFRGYLRASYSFFDKRASGQVVNLATLETQRVGSSFLALASLVANSIIIVGYVAVLFVLSPAMTGLAVLFLLAAGLLVSWFVRKTRSVSRDTTAANERFSVYLVERLMALRLIKLTATTEREIDRVDHASARVRDNMYWLNKLRARVDLLLEPTVIVGGLVILYLAVAIFHMSLAQVGLFMLVLLRLMPLCKEVLGSRQTFLANAGGLEKVEQGLEESRANQEPEQGGTDFTGIMDAIRLESLTFTYPGQDEPALKELSMELPAGKMTALVGPSGAGKSTLVDLLPCLREPDSGGVLFDGTDGRDFDRGSLRRNMAFVSQDAFIFNDTARANICFARPEANDEELWDILRKSRADEFVCNLPEGLDTILGERGARLSGGQRQRLSLARALIQNAPILILDEPTSALDSEVEKDIQKTIDEMRRSGKVTIVAIAHRLSTISEADRIVVLRDGRVVEQGTHQELMVSEDWYHKICGLQNI
ncbi:MAG: ABC transporter ATP-binding protein [Desulfovibrio sp.]|nr:MAG: ABC transporter ATP-binding protein [Desulfovibrio sp.]